MYTVVRFFALQAKNEQQNKIRTYAVGRASLRQRGTPCSMVCGFSALRAEKPHTKRSERTMLPQAKHGSVTQKSATA